MKKEEQFEEKRESKFNAALAKLERIHKLRIGCHEYRMRRDWNTLYDILLSIRTEINDRMNEGQKNKANKYQRSIIEAMKGKRLAPFRNRIVRGNYRGLLYDYELFLCELTEDFGMGMPDKEGVGDSISQME